MSSSNFLLMAHNITTNISESRTERIEGSIDRVTFHAEETGFCVLRVKVKGQRDLMTVIGNVTSVAPGEYITCQGNWWNDKKHGLQFKAKHIQIIPPSTLEGIEKYLSSGIVKGIGPHFAKKLVAAFGEQVFEVIEQDPNRLLTLEGIGEKRKEQVVHAWTEQKAIRDIMIFLQSHGVSSARAVRIYKTYGDLAIKQVLENPYRLAHDIHGIGFKTADILAMRLGFARDSLLRAQAGIHYVLQQICQNGHCAATEEQLIEASVKLLEIEEPIIKSAILHEINTEKIITEIINDSNCIFPISLYQSEVAAAKHLQRIRRGSPPWGIIDTDKAVAWVEEKSTLLLSDSQKKAVRLVLQHKLTIITGGPGVGKTTIVKSLLNIVQTKRLSIALAAPTGRAAKRLQESTGLIAKTIHRLLSFDPKKFSFKYHQQHPLPIDLLVIDEASMIDIVLFYHLLRAIPDHAGLIIIGDIDQLPSVGPGAVLMDMIHAQTIPTVRLTEIFRQAAHSQIIVNAHRINRGEMPLPNTKVISDFYTIYPESREDIQPQLLNLVACRIPQFLNCHPIKDIQVLTPMNRGGLGSWSLNIDLQKQLNGSSEPKIMRYGTTFAPGDKVIQTINNYDKDIFNGDIGFITQIDLEKSVLKVLFDQRIIEYDFTELDELNLAYAISIHKSQGSEFPVVVMPVAMQHFLLLAKNILYTAVTRGKNLVVLIGEKKAVGMAVNNNQENARLTNLTNRLKQLT